MKDLKGNLRPWKKAEETVFLPKELDDTFRFEVKWSGVSKPKDDGKSTASCSIKLWKDSEEIPGTFWCDAFDLGAVETSNGVEFLESGICDIKNGKVINVKGE